MRRWLILGIVGLSSVAVARRLNRSSTTVGLNFDPVIVGSIEADGWKAYYDRNMFAGFILLVRLMRQQFRLGPVAALRAAHAAVRAQMAFAPKDNDLDAALRWLTRFYSLSPRNGDVSAEGLAGAELEYWVVHRQIVDMDDKTQLIDAFARLHALLFGGDEATQRQSATERTLACTAVDRITSRKSTNPDHDWHVVRQHLIAAYQAAIAASASSVGYETPSVGLLQSGSSDEKPASLVQRLRAVTSPNGRRAATPQRPVG